MKSTKYLFLVLVGAMACSKDEPAAPALESSKVTATTVTAPTALTASTDDHAQLAASYIQLANGLTSWTSFLSVAPNGATKSTTTIKAANGRISSVQGNTVTYTWSDQQGNTVGYQITDNGVTYTWEFFYKFSGSDVWIKYIDANETKDGTTGYLKVLDAFGVDGSDASAIIYEYDWLKAADAYTFTYKFGTDHLVLNINLKTKAGNIDYYEGAILTAHYEWIGDGTGSWETYDDKGVVTDSGTW